MFKACRDSVLVHFVVLVFLGSCPGSDPVAGNSIHPGYQNVPIAQQVDSAACTHLICYLLSKIGFAQVSLLQAKGPYPRRFDQHQAEKCDQLADLQGFLGVQDGL